MQRTFYTKILVVGEVKGWEKSANAFEMPVRPHLDGGAAQRVLPRSSLPHGERALSCAWQGLHRSPDLWGAPNRGQMLQNRTCFLVCGTVLW